MRLKNQFVPLIWIVIVLLLLAACGPGGLVLGLGPVLDHLVGLLLFALLIVGCFWAVKSPAGQAIVRQFSGAEQRMRDHFDSKAEEILRERYARGDIDRTQYLATLDDLKRK